MKNKLGLLSISSAICVCLSNRGCSNEQIKDFLDTAEILIDSGWECSETGFDSVWINLDRKKICLVNEHHYKYENPECYGDDYIGWAKVLEDEEK